MDFVRGPIFHHPGILGYDFGPSHPLKPERMRRTLALLDRWGIVPEHPGEGSLVDVLRVHDRAYVNAIFAAGRGETVDRARWGLGGDNPIFPKMGERSLDYVAGVAAAARAVVEGAAIAICLDGGLHHAHRARASGFCIFDDPAIAISILRERFARVAYVDIDVHHGDGPEGIFRGDPSVLTCSIHEEGRTLFPGTGWAEETGAGLSVLNVPLPARTGEAAWLDAFARTVSPKIPQFDIVAIILQMRTDVHHKDPLGHLRGTQDAWLAAIKLVLAAGKPIVAVGGGGYDLTTVPRMWASAAGTLLGVAYDDVLPADLASRWGVAQVSDGPGPTPHAMATEARAVADRVRAIHGLSDA